MLCRNNGVLHEHETLLQSKICWGVIVPPAPPAPRESMATLRQIEYAVDLGGNREMVTRMTKVSASAYIDGLKKAERETKVTEAAVKDTRIEMLRGLMPSIPNGRFAIPLNDSGAMSFIRISTPKSGRLKGFRKVQTQHGDNLVERAIITPDNGTMHVFHRGIVDDLLAVVVDYRSAAIRYGQELGLCCRCGRHLTDERSRHYGIGPECEGHFPWVIQQVDDAHAGV